MALKAVRSKRPLAWLLSLCFFGNADGAARIASSTNIGLCLHAPAGKTLELVDCLHSPSDTYSWKAWDWAPTAQSGRQGYKTLEGTLCTQPKSRRLAGSNHSNNSNHSNHSSGSAGSTDNAAGCVGSDLKLHDETEEVWSWSESTMKITHKGKCLTVVDAFSSSPTVELAECYWAPGDLQNKGGPAAQSWILLPAKKPWLDVVDELKLPLRAAGRYFVDTTGRAVKLVGVNWYGAHMEQMVNNGLDRQSAKDIAARIKQMGFNSVRLNYALNLTDNRSGSFPPVSQERLVAGDPSLKGKNVLEVFDACVKALTDVGLLVILNVHMSEAGWCCNLDDNNALWYNNFYSEEDWMNSLQFLAARYSDDKRVIGFDIRNEPRLDGASKKYAYWGVWKPGAFITSAFFKPKDWRIGATRGAVATWKGNPDAIIIVEGMNFAMHLKYVEKRKMKLAQDCLFSRVAYENHDYPFFDFSIWDWLHHPTAFWRIFTDTETKKNREEFDGMDEGTHQETLKSIDHKRFKEVRDTSFLFLHSQDKAPIWTGEFGSNDRNSSFWQNVMQLYKEVDYSWCYWPLDAVTVLDHFSKAVVLDVSLWPGRNDTYGLFDHAHGDYKSVVGWKVQDLISIMGNRVDFQDQHEAPEQCVFDVAANEKSASGETTLWEMITTTNWSLWLTLMTLLCFIGVLCCCACGSAYRVIRGISGGDTARVKMLSPTAAE